jgi:integrase
MSLLTRRFQRGYVYRKADSWYVRYSDNGVQRAHRLARVVDCRTKSAARQLADEFLAPINAMGDDPSSAVKLLDFVEDVYFPAAESQLRASTYTGYRNLWAQYLYSKLGGIKLREFRTADGERLLQAIAQDHKLSVTTFRHIKAFLSGVFRYAKRLGILGTENPVRDVAIPKANAAGETHAYALDDILRMLEFLPEPAATVVAVAAFTGVRRGELRGLRWEDYDGKELKISRSFWRSIEQEPKTAKSKAPVPVIPQLAKRLELHRPAAEVAANDCKIRSGLMFPGQKGLSHDHDFVISPVDLDRLVREVIAPALRSHGLEWHGWHAFRRGLATNLHHLGVQDKVIQRILRHSNVSVTQACYIKTADKDVEAAMEKLAGVSG